MPWWHAKRQMLSGAMHYCEEFVVAQRLLDIIERAFVQGVHGGLQRCVTSLEKYQHQKRTGDQLAAGSPCYNLFRLNDFMCGSPSANRVGSKRA